jgi:transposase InsO family protein
VDLIVGLRGKLTTAGLDAGPDTIAWHLAQHHDTVVSVATISRYLNRAGLVRPEPKKKPKSSYIRFAAALPNETWRSDFTHYRLAEGTEIVTWLDDCIRYALHVSAHPRITSPIVVTAFRKAAGQDSIPASTLTDNGMVFTTRLSGGKGGRNALEHQLRAWHVVQKNSRPSFTGVSPELAPNRPRRRLRRIA